MSLQITSTVTDTKGIQTIQIHSSDYTSPTCTHLNQFFFKLTTQNINTSCLRYFHTTSTASLSIMLCNLLYTIFHVRIPKCRRLQPVCICTHTCTLSNTHIRHSFHTHTATYTHWYSSFCLFWCDIQCLNVIHAEKFILEHKLHSFKGFPSSA